MDMPESSVAAAAIPVITATSDWSMKAKPVAAGPAAASPAAAGLAAAGPAVAETVAAEAAVRGEGDRELSDYFGELLNIERLKETRDRSTEELSKTPDEAEQEMGWLEDAGFGHLVSRHKDGILLSKEVVNKETSALTHNEAAIVQKRIDTLNETLRKRGKQQQQVQQNKMHVKDIFALDGNVNEKQEPVSKSKASNSILRQRSGSLKNENQDLRLSSLSSTNGHQFKAPSHRTSLLRTRGEYCISSNGFHAGTAVDSMYGSSGGIEALKFRLTSEGGASRSGGRSQDTVISADKSSLRTRFSDQLINVAGTELDANGLPELSLIGGSHGITYTTDLSAEDLNKIRSLALIDLTSLYDSQGISLTRGKPSRPRLSDSGLFGIPLQTLLEHDQKKYPHLRVPYIFVELVHHLEKTSLDEEGIFRVPGSLARMKVLQHELDSAYKRGRELKFDEIGPHDGAGLLKQLLRDLPAPLLTSEYLEAFLQVDRMHELRQKLESLNLLILLLPSVNRDTLQLILELLSQVVANPHNKMTMKSVAMIMAPNLFRVKISNGGNPADREFEIGVAARTSNLVLLLIKYHRMLWAVPEFLLLRIRNLNQSSIKRSRKSRTVLGRLLGRSMKAPTTNNGKSSSSKQQPPQAPVTSFTSTAGMIRITAPELSKFNSTLQLDGNLTAGDVVARFVEPALNVPNCDNIRDSTRASSASTAAPATYAAANSAKHTATAAAAPAVSSAAFGSGESLDDINTAYSQGGSSFKSSTSSLNQSATDNLNNSGTIHLYEIGGNIGERRLDSSANMLSLYHINPRAEWVVKHDVTARPN